MFGLGIILIGTGILVFFSGNTMIRTTKKNIQKSRFLTGQEPEKELEYQRKSEEEFIQMVKKSMYVLYAVGITCILLGILMIMFSS